MPSLPEPDDIELLAEVSWVALLNDRVEAIGFLIDRGLPIDYLGWGMPLLNFAVMRGRVEVAEYLVKRGANLDLKGWRPHMTARELARDGFVGHRDQPSARRMLEICDAGDPVAVLAEADARRPEPQPVASFLDVLALAGDDAARRGQSEIHADNVFIGLLRVPTDLPLSFVKNSGGDLVRLREAVGDRLFPASDRLERPKLPLDTASRAAIEGAFALARERRSDVVNILHLLQALVDEESGPVAALVTSVGADRARLREELRRAL